MKLGYIFGAIDAWRKLASLRMKPRMAYRLAKYAKEVSAEWEFTEKQRVALIHELSGVPEGQPASIQQGTPEFAKYTKRFMEIMETDCDLRKIDLNFDKVLDAIGENQENELTPQEVDVLLPFFSESVELALAEAA